MAYHWLPPSPGTLKINVHGVSALTPLPNANDTCIGAIYRNANGDVKHVTIGMLPDLSPLGNQPWTVYSVTRRAFLMGYINIQIETYNHVAYRVIRNFNAGAPAAVYDIAKQIHILSHDHRWLCVIAYVFSAKNRAARYVAKLGMELCDMLYTLHRPVGGIEQLADWDMGLGVDYQDYVDSELSSEAPDPVDFGSGLTLADQVNSLGLGQMVSPTEEVIARESRALIPEDEEMQEESFLASHAMNEGVLFSEDTPLQDID